MARFSRIHPTGITAPGGTIDLGAALGCLRYMPRRPPGVRVRCGTGYSLTLDPAHTSPAALIGVSFTGGKDIQEYVILTPGDSLTVPDGFTEFSVFNADQLDQVVALPPRPANAPLGYCSFLISHEPGARPHLAPNAVPDACIIQAGTPRGLRQIVQEDSDGLFFGCGALRAIKVTLFGMLGTTITGGSRQSFPVAAGFLSHAQYFVSPPWPSEEETLDTPRILTGVNSLWTTAEAQHWGSSTPDVQGLAGPYLIFDVPRGAVAGQLYSPAPSIFWSDAVSDTPGCIIEGIR